MSLALLTTLVVALGASCQSIPVERRDWSAYDGPGARYFQHEEVAIPAVEDRFEALNRGVWDFDLVLLRALVLPAGELYAAFVPAQVRSSITKVFRNALYPVRLANNLFQGKWDGAWRETQRFAVNTTAGVGGLWDPATRFGIEPSVEDMGQTFAVAGWRRSSFLVVPFWGPTTVRDGLGSVLDLAFDPLIWLSGIPWGRMGHRVTQAGPGLERTVETNYDAYSVLQFLLPLGREVKAEDLVRARLSSDGAATETLQVVFLGSQDPAFAGRARTGRVPAPSGRFLSYSLWLRPEERAPIVYVLPGLGGHRLSDGSLALAEMAYRYGFSAVAVSSTFSHEVIASRESQALPGFAPDDARDLALVLTAIRGDLERRHPGRVGKEVLLGSSLGAFHTLYVAAEAREEDPPTAAFDLYVAINPPVRLEYAMERLDAYFNTPLRLPPGEREAMVEQTLRKTLALADGSLYPTRELPFTEEEARFLIGLSFRNTLKDVIFQTQERHDRGVLLTPRSRWRRQSAYEEILDYSFLEYFYGFVLPYLAEARDDVALDEAGAARVLELCDLRSIAGALAADERVWVVANDDDFLSSREDLAWMRSLLGPRYIHYAQGGHLGNLHLPEVQHAIMTLVRERTGEPRPTP